MFRIHWRAACLGMLVLTAVTLASYWPLRQAQFTNFDDPEYVTNNPQVFHGLSWRGVGWAFTTFHASNWHPLTWLSHMLDCSVFGEQALGHHVVNVGLHIANTLGLFLLLWRMTGAGWRSGFVAGLFAVHPLHVESVAWIAERKDVLSAFFGLLTLWTYAEYAGKQASAPNRTISGPTPGRLWFVLSLGCFGMGLMSKPMLVTLPFVMLLLDYWPLGRLRVSPHESVARGLRPLIWEKAGFWLLAAASAIVTFYAQGTKGAVVPLHVIALDDRLANTLTSYVRYLHLLCWPAQLAVFYPFPKDISMVAALLALMLLASISGCAIRAARQLPAVLMGWLWFLGTLVPVIGLVQVGSQALADRYMYLPSIGLFVSVTWGVAALAAKRRGWAVALGGLGATVVACFMACTRVQDGYWMDGLHLFRRAVEVTKGNWMAEHNLGHALASLGHYDEAAACLDRSMEIEPNYPPAYLNRAGVYAAKGRLEEAIVDYRTALRLKPNYEQAYCNLGKALALQLRFDEAKTNFLAALYYKPDYIEAHIKLANVLLLQGNVAEALPHLQEAVRLDPKGSEGLYYLGAGLARARKHEEAAEAFRKAIKSQPDYASALNDLAWLLATTPQPEVKNLPEAIRLAQRACDLTTNREPMYLDTLGVALAETGRMPDAAAITERAAGIAKTTGNTDLATRLETRANDYRSGKSYTQIMKVRGAAKPQ